MAIFVFTDGRIEINSVVMSTFVKKITLKIDVDDLDATAFGGNGYKARMGGLKDWSVDLEFNQDFAASAVDVTIWPLLGTVVPVKIRPTTAAISATNPEFSGSVLVKEYAPLDGSVGDLTATGLSWPGASALARATS